MIINRFIRAISTKRAVNISAFSAGFVWTIGPPVNLLDTPLSTTFKGTVGGGIACVGADLVHGFMLPTTTPILVAALTGSAFFHGGVNIYKSFETVTKELSSMFPSR